MKYIKLPCAALVTAWMAIACGDALELTKHEDLILTEVHLQQGFEDHWAVIEVNGEVQFKACLDSGLPLSGPQASISLELAEGRHHLVLRWVPKDGNLAAHVHRFDILLEADHHYYLGLAVTGDEVDVVMQENPFLYV